ncbi:bifunctional isocitrate dehydrogenase kinase/phosphatase [Aliiglaciecola sp. 2_MG-2023]|uniref:bifunctional isocitrate dehydrogenase kinase/phosphatase n=1 Tax=unclassified Aliiglaciecola TaxID=2593648 RepID=UPI0026E30CA3|nr:MULTISPECIES: bifunctional isocitrate dehydrogenase kinase/phosphatase [unclassified Aliiglaciecola]MDO6711455.1 bifunctional isocitrate dehydrogenase kinase/phosphatase [Aliiglaciecola sp. 2_MG-2023]MDO6752568.1 bifunctional isocitrate dehydrogenase kinase/phosphatase [Aliiglaciecola sp. 1_MG-2023]
MPSIQEKVAYQILYGFEKNYRWFCRITSGAKQRFEQAQWQATQLAVKERISIYEQSLADTISELYALINPRQQTHQFWHQVKNLFALQLEQHPQYELAETFYNSVIGRLYKHNKIDEEIMFVLPSRCYIPGQDKHKVVNSFDTSGTVGSMMEAILAMYRFSIPYENKQSDIEQLDQALRARLDKAQLASVHTVEILKPVFFRGKAAYLIGRICMPDETLPFVIALLINEKNELQIDALLTSNKDLSVIFGFARAYFMADTLYPAEIVAFLQELMPNKKNFELYMSIGHYKHGKTVFYRNFLQHLENTDDQFSIAPGIRGLVMAVFHLPSYGVVFKIIKDEFPESKRVTREQVRECYRLVKTTDRVGRMADTHEYVNFRLPKHRMEPALLEELQAVAGKNIEIKEDEVIIKHVYIERKMTPLNIFLQTETDETKIYNAINDLGLCIKQIAAANIFPGDMLHKNFGVTRHGRVIFYDYDEICLMNQRTFRELPKSDDPFAMDTLSVSPEDVFPEQFEHFIVGKRHLKDLLKKLHPDLMTAKYWIEAQNKAATGTVQHFTPYSSELRFKRQ